MRTPLEKKLRGKLETTVEKAREIVEVAVTEAVTRLGIGDGSAPGYLSEAERKLRTRLRAHGRQLGDLLNRDSTSLAKANSQETELLINEMAYEHWHRMLFARFLEQNELLMYDENTPITLDDCVELVEEGDPLGDGSEVKDGWDLAGRLAQKMLPQIFRADSPVFDVKLSINHVQALEEIIASLHPDTFQASDALGWCYQFWQNKKKKQVNESGVKIGAKELSPVTQLFTEPYMVSFLLDNALGAWWAKRRLTQDDLATATSEQELRELASIPGVPLEYLRFIQNEETNANSEEKVKSWKLAAGDFEQWPDDLSEFKTLDPCCGSGHFLVAKFLMLVPMRMELEGLTAKEAIDKVLVQNIHGLELDQRCVELAVFALALEAWRYPKGGYRQLPELQLACSGMSIIEAEKEWIDLAKGDDELQDAIKWMQQTFKDAPTLGSLIDPNKSVSNAGSKPWAVLQEAANTIKEVSSKTKTIAHGLAKSAGLLSNKYQWVVTNVPYLGDINQEIILKNFIEKNYLRGKKDLANAFSIRCLNLLATEGVSSIVLPQNWLFLKTYKSFRELFLRQSNFSMIARLGSGAFDTISGEVVKAILWSFHKNISEKNYFQAIDVSESKGVKSKSISLVNNRTIQLDQNKQFKNPDSRISIDERSNEGLLANITNYGKGSTTGDGLRLLRYIWEFDLIKDSHVYWLNSPIAGQSWTGRSQICRVRLDDSELTDQLGCRIHGQNVFKQLGVAVNKMSKLEPLFYRGEVFDDNICPISPHNHELLPALWAYVASDEFHMNVREVDQALKVTAGTITKIPFDLEKWNKVATELYPNGLPQPYANDIKQWIFHGHPCASVIWDEDLKTTAIGELREEDNTVLQVAVARLLGYRWPAELDTEMELAPEMRDVIAQNKVFDALVDDDGIVCIPAIRGEKPAVDRLEAILYAAYGDKWSATVLNNLLKSVKSRDLTIWLRDKFFEQHCKLFQHRPFIWHIWDGLPEGFSALVNYHQLDYKGLERLIYTYLDDWISTQIQLEKDGDEGAEMRLAAARNLRKQLEDILIGDSLPGQGGLDIFVRWKSLEEQPIGWNPDLNDGVRLNIRPFMKAKDVGKKEAGILRSKPNIHWKKDRGTDVESAPWFDLGLEYGGKQGDRINDHHLTLAEKKAARATSGEDK